MEVTLWKQISYSTLACDLEHTDLDHIRGVHRLVMKDPCAMEVMLWKKRFPFYLNL